ncbi:MAG: succinate dehydrogenase assembly factor 4 [Pseudomonadota bacterium]
MTDQKPDTNTEKGKKADSKKPEPEMEKEIGGPEGPEPTRYGDWEVGGRCTDF